MTSVHPAGDSRIFYKQCKTLLVSGYGVVLVAPHDATQEIDGITIRAVPRPRNRRERMLSTVWQVYRTALKEDADVYHFHDPELIPVGIFLSLQGKMVIYDVHEDLPRQIMSKPWIPKWLRGPVATVAEAVEGFASRFFTGVVAATPAIAKRFTGTRVIVVQNFPVITEFSDGTCRPYAERPNHIAYVGGITRVRGAKEMVEAISLLPEDLGASLILAGEFQPASIKPTIQELDRSGRMCFVGWQDRKGVSELLGNSRVGLVVLHPIQNYLDSYPVKLFEYMASGLPVVASNFPLWRDIIEQAGCGLLVDPLNPRQLAEAIEWLLTHPQAAEDMGHRGLRAVQDRYTWETQGRRLLELYSQITGGRNQG